MSSYGRISHRIGSVKGFCGIFWIIPNKVEYLITIHPIHNKASRFVMKITKPRRFYYITNSFFGYSYMDRMSMNHIYIPLQYFYITYRLLQLWPLQLTDRKSTRL